MATEREGTFAKVGAIAGVIGVFVAVAAAAHWWPFSSPSTSSSTPSSTVAASPSFMISTSSPITTESTAAATQMSTPSPTAPAPPQYSQVPLGVLCANQIAQSNFDNCGGDDATVRIGQNAYVFSSNLYVYDTLSTALSFPQSTCRSLSLSFVLNPGDLPPSTFRLTVTVVRSQGQTESTTIGPNQLGTLDVSLSSGPWEIQTLDNYDLSVGLYMDGSGNCSTSIGS